MRSPVRLIVAALVALLVFEAGFAAPSPVAADEPSTTPPAWR